VKPLDDLRAEVARAMYGDNPAPAAARTARDNRPRYDPVPEYPKGYLKDEYEDYRERLNMELAVEQTPRGARYRAAHQAELDRFLVLETERQKQERDRAGIEAGGKQSDYEKAGRREEIARAEREVELKRRIAELQDEVAQLTAPKAQEGDEQ
jgi:hypothetical protein